MSDNTNRRHIRHTSQYAEPQVIANIEEADFSAIQLDE
jgi:hypothetical protein